MKYTIKYYNKWKQPYPYGQAEDSQMCEHEDFESYATASLKICQLVIKDFLDAPLTELSLEEIHEDFDNGNEILPEEKAVQIQAYYNGRLALLNSILNDLEDQTPRVLHYSIPEQYNSFIAYGEDDGSYQLDAYIEVKISEA